MSIYWFYVIGNLSFVVTLLFFLSLIPLAMLFCTIIFGDYHGEEQERHLHRKWCKYIAGFS